MSFLKLQVVNFGKSKGAAAIPAGVGFTVRDHLGSVIVSRTTGSVHELGTNTGIYAAYVSYPDSFHGDILWDTGTAFSSTYYAGEEFNYEANNPNVDNTLSAVQSVTGSIQLIRDMTEGRWQIIGNQMIFFDSSNSNEVARFDLYDDLGMPSMDAVFERVRVP